LSLVEVHEITERARHELLHRVPRLVDVVIHSNPSTTDNDLNR
jgi:divalent metal cation (Fe/Co/Zn/Cd) transporter